LVCQWRFVKEGYVAVTLGRRYTSEEKTLTIGSSRSFSDLTKRDSMVVDEGGYQATATEVSLVRVEDVHIQLYINFSLSMMLYL
jgi:hypothetical protein